MQIDDNNNKGGIYGTKIETVFHTTHANDECAIKTGNRKLFADLKNNR